MAVTVDSADFSRDLDNLINNLLPSALRDGVYKACLFVEAEAKEGCPINIGQLQGSIEAQEPKVVAGGTVEGYVTAGVGADVEHALFVHEGTYKMQARPFLKNAVEQNQNEIKKIIEKSIKN